MKGKEFMKRNIKNIVLIILIILICTSMVFVVKNVKSSSENNNIPSMPNNSATNNIPSMPNDNNSNAKETMPKPDENNSQEEKDNSSTEKDNNQQENENSSSNENNNPPSMPNNSATNNMPSMPNNSNSNLSIIYYIIFGLESLLLGAIISYLILSCFNKKDVKETFKNKDKIIIYIMSTIILTTIFVTINAYFATKTLSNNQSSFEPSNNNSVTYSASEEITDDKTITSGNYTSTKSDENALIVTSKSNISNIKVTKTGDSTSTDANSFYGNNSAILAKDGATLTLDNITVTTSAKGANGVFSYGGSATTNNTNSDGTTINIKNSKITTKADSSGGLMTTGGGTMNATNLQITTKGTSSAAIRSDRGGGTVNVEKGTYKTSGQGSPVIYSTANITVKDATLTSTSSEGVVIEGKNSVALENVTLTDTNNKLNGQSTTYKNIFLYQSMSGDASNGTATFTAKNSNIITNKGDTFYITNTKATINLTNNKITNNDKNGNFLRSQKDSWGQTGSNGGDVTLNMTKQKAKGNIVIDAISTLTMNLKSSSYEGTINGDNTAKTIKLTLDKTSSIKLTGDSYVTSLDNEDSTNSNIDFNGYKLYVNNKAIN